MGMELSDAGAGLQRAIFKNILDNLFDGVCFMDLEKKITYWNKGAEVITGYKGQDVIGTCDCDSVLRHVSEKGKPLCNGSCPVDMVLRTGKQLEESMFINHRDGHRLPVLVCIAPVSDGAGKIVGAVEIITDDSWKHAAVKKIQDLKRLALLDPLTEIGNRRHAEISLVGRLDELKRNGTPFGVLLLDIDHFKGVNDTYGHSIGDLVLQMVARTLSNTLRPYDVICRYGGEEFLLIASNITEKTVNVIAERLRLLVKQSSFSLGPHSVGVTVSIGATLADPADSVDTIVRRADVNLYKSKESGRNCVSVG